MSNIFFTSDTHFGHAKILELGDGRPFSSIEEHDEALIENWNRVVRKGDTVYHLGDLSFADYERTVEIVHRLRGQIHLFNGNHDRFNPRLKTNFPSKIQWVGDYKEIRVKTTVQKMDGLAPGPEQKIVLMHYPLGSWNGAFKGAWMLHGHSHGMYKYDGRGPIIDVGVDVWDYTPASFDQVRSQIENACATWAEVPMDGHGRTPVVPHEDAIAEQRAMWAGVSTP